MRLLLPENTHKQIRLLLSSVTLYILFVILGRVISTQLLILAFKNKVTVTSVHYINCVKGDEMQIVAANFLFLTMTASSLLAGNCANHNKANLEAMSCEAGFTWNETKAECVQDTA